MIGPSTVGQRPRSIHDQPSLGPFVLNLATAGVSPERHAANAVERHGHERGRGLMQPAWNLVGGVGSTLIGGVPRPSQCTAPGQQCRAHNLRRHTAKWCTSATSRKIRGAGHCLECGVHQAANASRANPTGSMRSNMRRWHPPATGCERVALQACSSGKVKGSLVTGPLHPLVWGASRAERF